ncbi:hypothetical protein A8709_32595 [Paenibacillus pectinilyticus]|uniref:HTH araC/xylS-type domain-containing protein n=1 Tax=Paenibacillus pectinilyticus TaxID=512399 RepID=A0A1C0ZWZ6_9BACL|nr:helix-turn-helix domain-containing protein [Paenibacillus pectinilyticus]OCT12558.1 hypothetical protein A8709_32595 [Paenibacillus pectinilyticus]
MRLLIVIGMVGLLPILVANVVSYYSVTSKFKTETMAGNEKLLAQTVSAVELMFHQVENTSRQLLFSPSMQIFQSYTDSEKYEAYTEQDITHDQVNYYNYWRMKEESLRYMESFRVNNDFIESVYFYDSVRNQVLDFEASSPLVQKNLEAFTDNAWQSEVDSLSPMSVRVLGTRTLQKGFQQKKIMTIVIRTSFAHNAFAINIDADYLFNKALKKLDSADHYYVVDGDNQIIMTDQQQKLFQIWSAPAKPSKVNISSSVMNIDGTKQVVTSIHSSELPWTFVYTSDYNQVLRGTNAIMRTVILTAVILIMLMLIIVYFSTSKLYQPILKLSSTLRAGLQEVNASQSTSDELQWIGRLMHSTILERQELISKLNDALPMYREHFKLSLLRGQNQTLEQLKERLNSLGIKMTTGGCLLLLIEQEQVIEHGNGASIVIENPFEEAVKMLELKSSIEASGCMEKSYEYVEVNTLRLAVIVQLEEEFSEKMTAFFRDLHNKWLSSGTLCSIGVSRYVHSIAQLPQAYLEAKEALEYRRMLGGGSFICIDEVALPVTNHFTYPKEKADLVYRFVKLADSDGAAKSVNDFIKELEVRHLPFEQYQSLLVHFLSGLLEELIRMGINPVVHNQGENNVYTAFLKRSTIPDMKNWLLEFVASECQAVAGQLNNDDNSHISRLMELINQQIVSDVSLSVLATQLGLNSAYISRLFKQETGQNFSEYIKELRIERSKQMLAQTELQIQQIAEQIGYNNSYYFIRIFKESVGMTPGEYKKLIKQSSS